MDGCSGVVERAFFFFLVGMAASCSGRCGWSHTHACASSSNWTVGYLNKTKQKEDMKVGGLESGFYKVCKELGCI